MPEEELQSYSLQNGDHNSKLGKLRQQRNMFQMKEQDKTPEEQSGVETGGLPEKQFKVMLI